MKLHKYKRFMGITCILLLIVLCFSIFIDNVFYLFRPVTPERRTIAGYYAEKENTIDLVYVGGKYSL